MRLIHTASMLLMSSLALTLAIGLTAVPTQAQATAETSAVAEVISVFGEGTLTVPAEFKKGKPASRIVQYEFVASAGEGDDVATARVYAMPSGGGVGPNIARWKAQFSGNEDAFKQEEMKLGDWKVYLVDHAGKFSERMGGGPFAPGKTVVREDYAMTGAIIESQKGQLYFVKMVGPQDVVKANREAFVKMIKSIQD